MAVAPPVRIPLAQRYDNRLHVEEVTWSDRDSVSINVMYEPKMNEQGLWVLKRPAVQTLYHQFTPGIGQGMETFHGTLGAVINDNFVQINPPNVATTGQTWAQASSGPWTGRAYPQAVVLNNAMYLMGGVNSGGAGYFADVWVCSDGWTWVLGNGSAPWGERSNHSATVLNGTIYLCAGQSSASPFLNDVWSSPDGVTWTQLSDPTNGAAWSARIDAVLLTVGNNMFLMGGYDGTNRLNDIWSSTDGTTWTQITPTAAFPARSGFAAFYFNNAIYVAGGYGNSGILNDCWRSTDAGQSWQQMSGAAFSTGGLAYMGYTIYNGKMWTVNGAIGVGAVTNNVYSSPDGITWTLVTANGPIAANQGLVSVTFKTPQVVSPEAYPTMFAMGGTGSGPGYTAWRAILDIPAAASIPLNPLGTGEPYQFNTFVENTVLLIKNQTNLWVYNGAANKVTDVGYPIFTVPGLVVIGGFAYVMDINKLIHCCAADDPYTWPSTNVIGADYGDDSPVAIAKYKNYLVAFGEETTQFFYDAGRNPGSPLLPYLNANLKIGLAESDRGMAAQNLGDFLIFIAHTEGKLSVMILAESLTPQTISTPYIENALTEHGVVNCFTFNVLNHQFFVVTTEDETWVYDLATKEWVTWRYSGSTIFDFSGAIAAKDAGVSGGGALLLDPASGAIYRTALTGGDYAGAFMVRVQTDRVDGGNNRMKFWGQVEVIGDRSPARPTLEFTDDDYQTWSPARVVDMNTPRPILYRNGASRRRAFRYTQTDTNWMRLDALEVTIEQGA